MTIAYDAVSSDSCNYRSGGSWSHIIGNGSNRLLFVLFMGYRSGSITTSITGVSCGGVAGTQIYSYALGGSSGTFEIWLIKDPPVGNQTITYTSSASPSLAMAGISYNGVQQSDPYYTAKQFEGSSASPSVSALDGGDGFVVSFLGYGDGSVTVSPGTGQTERVENSPAPPNRGVWGSDESSDDEASASLSASTYVGLWAAVLREAEAGQGITMSGGAMCIM